MDSAENYLYGYVFRGIIKCLMFKILSSLTKIFSNSEKYSDFLECVFFDYFYETEFAFIFYNHYR